MHWGGTVGGAFQRSGLYEPGASDKRKKEFRDELRRQLESMENTYNQSSLSSVEHVVQIKLLQDWSTKYSDTLKGGKLNFGVSQKLLNLHLKGLWCFNLLKYAPPHFPVDRIIQQRLRLEKIIPWTKNMNENNYLKVIEAAEFIASKNQISLAELELRVYNNTLKISK